MHTEHVAGGQTGRFQNVRGANWEIPKCKGGQCIQCINFSKVLGGKRSPRGAHANPGNYSTVHGNS